MGGGAGRYSGGTRKGSKKKATHVDSLDRGKSSGTVSKGKRKKNSSRYATPGTLGQNKGKEGIPPTGDRFEVMREKKVETGNPLYGAKEERSGWGGEMVISAGRGNPALDLIAS